MLNHSKISLFNSQQVTLFCIVNFCPSHLPWETHDALPVIRGWFCLTSFEDGTFTQVVLPAPPAHCQRKWPQKAQNPIKTEKGVLHFITSQLVQCQLIRTSSHESWGNFICGESCTHAQGFCWLKPGQVAAHGVQVWALIVEGHESVYVELRICVLRTRNETFGRCLNHCMACSRTDKISQKDEVKTERWLWWY